MKSKEKKLTRRSMLKSLAAVGAVIGTGQQHAFSNRRSDSKNILRPVTDSVAGMRFEPRDVIRLGIIGVGLRGLTVLQTFLAVEGVKVTALCDLVPEKLEVARKMVQGAGQKAPALYSKNESDWENLCRREDIDLLYIATPWDLHVPMSVLGMKTGKHVGVEVPASPTLEGCWELVRASEKSRRHCVMMENCCYGYNEMMVLNMVQAGLFGELLHGEAAYNHDLREILFEDRNEGLWRRTPHTKRNGNLYPTHGLGPVAQYMGINRVDYFDHIVSISSPSLSLYEYRKDHVPRESKKWQERYVCGDINTSLIKTAQGRTILLQHTVSTPRPYDRINLIAGTKGIFRDFPPRVYFDGQEGGEKWGELDKLKGRYEHPLWTSKGDLARKLGGHGGMDFIMSYRLIQCMREGLVPDINVYDAAAWSAPGPLSEISVAKSGASIKFPDFTGARAQPTEVKKAR